MDTEDSSGGANHSSGDEMTREKSCNDIVLVQV